MLFTVSLISAQNMGKTVIASGGGSANNTEVTIGFTMGEPLVGLVHNDASIHQGFWAGSELIVEPLEDEDEDDLLGIVVYPNPVESELTIFTNNKEIYGITLFEVNGY